MNVAIKTKNHLSLVSDKNTGGMDELPNGTSLNSGKYTINEFINLNNLGIKYLGQSADGTSYIIKELYISDICKRAGRNVVHPSTDTDQEFKSLVQAFKLDLDNIIKLNNPNLGKIAEFFEENNTIYVVVEKPKGCTLHDRITETDNTLNPDQITDIMIKVLKALNQIHGLGVLHRDIDPRNIIITPTNEPVLFIDFSTFRNNTSKETRTVSKIVASDNPFTSLEMNVSPEEQSPASDIYSLAASFYFAIKGSAPKSIMQRVSAVATGENDPYEPLSGTIQGYETGILETIDMSLSVFSESRINSTIEWLMHLSHLLKKTDELDFKPVFTPPKEVKRKFHFPLRTFLLALMATGMCLILLSIVQYQ